MYGSIHYWMVLGWRMTEVRRNIKKHLLGQKPVIDQAGIPLTKSGDYFDASTNEWLLTWCPGFGEDLSPAAWLLEEGWFDPAPEGFQPFATAAELGSALRGQAKINLHATTYHYDRPFEACSTLLYVYRRGAPYTGGETVFPELGFHIDMKDGDLVIFHSQRTMHGNLPRRMSKSSERMALMIHVPGFPHE